MLTPLLDDDTWARLDPDAGVFTRQQRRRAFLAVIAAALVFILIWFVWWSGVLAPRLALEDSSSPGRVIGTTRTFRFEVMLVNHAPGAVIIRSVGRSGPGLKLLSVTGAGSPLAGSASERIELTYQVTDCSGVLPDEWPIPVTVQRRGGPRELMLTAPLVDPFWLDGPGQDSAGADDSSFGDTSSFGGTTAELGGEPWQAAFTSQICSPPDRAGDQ